MRDTTGAGDVFHGAFAAGLCRGLELVPAIELAARAAAVIPVVLVKRRMGHPIRWSWAPVIIWGGLRGSIPLALILSMQGSYQFYDTFLVLAFAVVLFSLVVQGLTMEPLLNRLGIFLTRTMRLR